MALTDKLSAIGIAIREKTGKSDLITLDAMPEEIRSISGGGGADLPAEAFNITDNCDNLFVNRNWDWFLRNYGNQVTTSNISSANMMFYGLDNFEEIPFTLNFLPGQLIDAQDMFHNNTNLRSVPTFNNFAPNMLNHMFSNCFHLTDFSPMINGIDWSYLDNNNDDPNTGFIYGIFSNCYSLRTLPIEFIKRICNPWAETWNVFYSGGTEYCISLDEMIDLPVPNQMEWWDNGFQSTVYNCQRLKDFIFETNEDGSPKTARWCSQELRFTENTGWSPTNSSLITSYSSGITEDKKVFDDASYQALKDDPDWFAVDEAYSRYNHDSAVATINSLPDTSEFVMETGMPNMIIFNGAAGSATDGGAINTLTEEEIAVAAAKGWTVSFE